MTITLGFFGLMVIPAKVLRTDMDMGWIAFVYKYISLGIGCISAVLVAVK